MALGTPGGNGGHYMSGKSSWLAVLVVVAFVGAHGANPRDKGQDTSGGEPAAIRRVLDAQRAAWNKGDIPAFLEGYWKSSDLTFSGSGGTVRGYDGVLERYRKSYPDRQSMGELEFSGLEVRLLGADAAVVLGQWHLKHSIGDTGGVFTLVFERFPEGWRIIHDHTSAQKEAH